MVQIWWPCFKSQRWPYLLMLTLGISPNTIAYLWEWVYHNHLQIINKKKKRKKKKTYSAMTVLPAEVWADTRTDCWLSKHLMASCWKGSKIKGYVYVIRLIKSKLQSNYKQCCGCIAVTLICKLYHLSHLTKNCGFNDFLLK